MRNAYIENYADMFYRYIYVKAKHYSKMLYDLKTAK